MSLFEDKAGVIIVPAFLRQHKDFKKIIDHKLSQNYLSYIYHSHEWVSPYARFNEHERHHQLKKDFLEGKEPPKYVENASKAYEELIQTDSSLLLKSARKAAMSLRDYFDSAEPSQDEFAGRAAKDLIANLKSVGDIIVSIEKWEEEIKKKNRTGTIRKGIEINEFNKG